jgi:hypothetical protein
VTNAAKILQTEGVYVVPQPWTGVSAFVEHLRQRPAYRNHVRQGKTEMVRPGDHPWTCHDMDDVVCAPGLLELTLEWTPVARAYLDAEPLLYSLNAFYCEPGAQAKPDIQEWHRDADDSKFLAMFIYCTDVLGDCDGPHQFVVGSHKWIVPNTNACSIYGPAGTVFLADTRGLHRGIVPTSGRRMIAWARWGVSDPPASYMWDKLRPTPRGMLGERFPRSHRTQRTIHLVVS